MTLLLALSLVLQAPPVPNDSLRAALLEAEDARAATPALLHRLATAVSHPDSTIQRQAVRAIGRLERPDLLERLAPALTAEPASVRLEAANAVAQSVVRGQATEAVRLLEAHLPRESHPAVRGAIFAALGRLPLTPAEAARVAGLLGTELGPQVATAARDGAIRGAWDLLRRPGRGAIATGLLAERLRMWALEAGEPLARRLALHALILAGRADSATVAAGLRDPDEQVRRLAILGAVTARELPDRVGLIRQAIQDESPLVRIEAMRSWSGATVREALGCEPLIRAVTTDPSVHVQLLAIDQLAAGCGPLAPPVALLDAVVQEPLREGGWHRQARALLALAAVDTARAAIRLGGFARSPIWWARAAAARAAGRLGDRAQLGRLLDDADDNVREAALGELVRLDGRAADAAALQQLDRGDYQLLLTAARALEQTTLGSSVGREAQRAFSRITAEGKETSRDTRLALLALVAAHGTAVEGRLLAGHRTDFDPVVASRVAAIATELTGTPVSAEPRPLPAAALPTPAQLRAMTEAVLVMADGGRLVLRLRPEEAPTSVARFVAMARAGWFEGLTLHRVVPNFVLQGGSPGANEYAGAAAFTRDEVGGSHRRGTVGISTRGRDTGDGQIFLNLVDNLRLDHDYTVIGEVILGLDVMDRIQEGAIIARVEVTGR